MAPGSLKEKVLVVERGSMMHLDFHLGYLLDCWLGSKLDQQLGWLLVDQLEHQLVHL